MAVQKTNAQLIALLKPYFKSRTDPSRTTLYTFNASTPPTSAEMAAGVCAANLMKDDYLLLLNEGGNDDNFYIMHPDRVNNTWVATLLSPAMYECADAVGGQTVGGIVTIRFDTEHRIWRAADFTYSFGEITFNRDGTYLHNINVTYDVDTGGGSTMTNVQTKLQVDTGGGFAAVPQTARFSLHPTAATGESSVSISRIITASAGDIYRVTGQSYSGSNTIVTLAQCSSWSIMQVG